MATALPRPQADSHPLRGLLFALWAVVVLAAYFSYHPLPMRAGVPVWRGVLTVAGMLIISWPLWRTAGISRGPQVEHLLLLPVLLTAALVMLPLSPAPVGLVLWCVWVPLAFWWRQRFAATGLLAALLLLFPGNFAATAETQAVITILLALLQLPLLLAMRRNYGRPHRYARRTAIVALAVGVLLALANIQQHYHPVGYLTGSIDAATWLAQDPVQPDNSDNPGTLP